MDRREKKSNPGFKYGAIGGFILVCVYLFFLLIFQGTNTGDLLAWLIALFVYFFIGRQAAYEQHRRNVRNSEINPIKGMAETGRGAAMLTSFIVWGYIILRGIIRDSLGIFVFVNPVSLFFAILVDVLIAMGLGTAGARSVAGKYRFH